MKTKINTSVCGPGTAYGLNLQAIYKFLQNIDPRLNPGCAETKERLVRAMGRVEVVLAVLDKDLNENQYILLHARDVYHQLEKKDRELWPKTQPSEPETSPPTTTVDP